MESTPEFPPVLKDPPYLNLFSFERDLDFHSWRLWIGSRPKICVHVGFLYVLGILFFGKLLMRRKPPWKGPWAIALWNLAFAIFSLMGFVRSLPEVLHLLGTQGFYGVTCLREGFNSASGFWSVAGVFSKILELGDTAFLILRKKPVSFLHWFHHVTVMVYTFGTFEYMDPSHRWFTVMNYFVHSLMYSYYFLRSLGVSVPRGVAMSITGLQVTQMIAGLGINGYSLHKIYGGIPCARNLRNVYWISTMYMVYLILFLDYFIKQYWPSDGHCGGHNHNNSNPNQEGKLHCH